MSDQAVDQIRALIAEARQQCEDYVEGDVPPFDHAQWSARTLPAILDALEAVLHRAGELERVVTRTRDVAEKEITDHAMSPLHTPEVRAWDVLDLLNPSFDSSASAATR